ncbi:MAG: DNA replication/repair protein RecF [Hyphomicrobiaceae bacterium]|nr:DNA replication/repair protein RecF [Hyphomicrobiaceae bacterium]
MSARSISRLRLTNFRNYATAALDLDSRHVVLTGPNGSGKTNLIEAVSLLAPGRGLRRAPFEQLALKGSDGNWAVAATVESEFGPADLGTGGGPGDPVRRVRINGANARTIEELADHVRLLWLTPAMDGLFTGPATDRRRFLDRLVMTLIPDHGQSVIAFEKAMRQRNKLLEDSADATWFAAVETEMAAHAAAIHFARTDSLGHLQQLAVRDIAGAFPAAILALTPLFEDEATLASSTALEAALRAEWEGARARDRAAGRTLSGPHRCDLIVTHRQKQMPAELCSTGEQKALLIGLILAHARLVADMAGQTPILLLDEIAAHLDPDRRAALFAALESLGAQCFMTGTDPMLFEALGERGQYVRVAEGRLTQTA